MTLQPSAGGAGEAQRRRGQVVARPPHWLGSLAHADSDLVGRTDLIVEANQVAVLADDCLRLGAGLVLQQGRRHAAAVAMPRLRQRIAELHHRLPDALRILVRQMKAARVAGDLLREDARLVGELDVPVGDEAVRRLEAWQPKPMATEGTGGSNGHCGAPSR